MGKRAFGPDSASPFTSGLMAGDFAFVSGQIGRDPKTGVTGKTVREQTETTIANLTAVLAEAGLELGDVVKTTVFLTDVTTIEEMNAVYRHAFPEPRPTRSTVGVSGLASPELKVEIEAIACVRGKAGG